MRKETVVTFAMVVIVCVLAALGIAALAAGATTKVAQSRSQAQMAQSRALEAEQEARQEAERSAQTRVLMQPALTQAETLQVLAFAGAQRDDEILEAFIALAMEDYNRRTQNRSMLNIGLVGVSASILFVLWLNWADKYKKG